MAPVINTIHIFLLQDDFWRRAEVAISSASEFEVVIEGVRGSSFSGDISIDDVSLTSGCLVCPGCKPIDGKSNDALHHSNCY